MNKHNRPKKIYPYRCKALSMDLLSIFIKYQNKKDFIEQLLREIKSNFGSITENDVACISEYLNIPENKVIKAAEIAGDIEIIPVKQHLIRICNGEICRKNGSEKIIEEVYKKLKITSENVTEDNKFKIEITCCRQLCEISPVIGIDNIFYGKLDVSDIEALLEYIGK